MARFNPPPGWAAPQQGSVPPESWEPPQEWPEAPQGWHFWLDDAGNPTSPPPGAWAGPSASDAATVLAAPPAGGWNNANQGSGLTAASTGSGQSQPVVQSQPSAPQAQTSAPAWNPPAQQPAATPVAPPKKKGKTGLIIGLIAGLLALALLIGGAFFFLNNQGPTLKSTDVDQAYSRGFSLGGHKITKVGSRAIADDGKTDPNCPVSIRRASDQADFSANGREGTSETDSTATALTVHYKDAAAAKKVYDEYLKKIGSCTGDAKTTVGSKSGGGSPQWANLTGVYSNGGTIGGAIVQWGNTVTTHWARGAVDAEQVAKDVKANIKQA